MSDTDNDRAFEQTYRECARCHTPRLFGLYADAVAHAQCDQATAARDSHSATPPDFYDSRGAADVDAEGPESWGR